MNHSHPDEMLPSYQDVMREQRRIQRYKVRLRLSGISLLCINIFLPVIVVWGYYMARYTDTIGVRISNITKYCNDSRYNIKPIPKSSYFAANVSVISIFVLCYALLWITSKFENYTRKRFMKKMIWKTWIVGTYLALLLTFIEILKCATGVPCPYFFSNQNITNFYCGNKEGKGSMPLSLEKLDSKLRKSFPSRRSAVYAFCTAFMYIYLDHFDIEIGLHATQQLVIMLMGSWLTYLQFDSWDQGENHLSDILVGALIGVIHAMMTVRSMFGSVFYSPIRASTRKIKITPDFRPSAPPMNFDEIEFTHALTTRNCESTQTIFASNVNESDENIGDNNFCTNNVDDFQNQEENEVMRTEAEIEFAGTGNFNTC